MVKFAVAGVVLVLGFAVSAQAAPRDNDPPLQAQSQTQTQMPTQAQPRPYDTESPARIRQEMDRREPDASASAPAERAVNSDRPAAYAPRDCANCPPPRNYDSTEVIKNTRDVDQSRVINTESVVEVPPRTKETNKLIIRENETRNVGVIQHNHKIIEKEIRYVKRAPVYRHYAPQPRVRMQTVLVPIVQQQSSCGCPCTCGGSHGGYAQGYAQAYVYARPVAQPATQYVLVPVDNSGAGSYAYAYAYR